MQHSHEGTLSNLAAIRDHIKSLIGDIATEVSGQALRAPSASIHDRLVNLVALEDQLAAVKRLVEHFEARGRSRSTSGCYRTLIVGLQPLGDPQWSPCERLDAIPHPARPPLRPTRMRSVRTGAGALNTLGSNLTLARGS